MVGVFNVTSPLGGAQLSVKNATRISWKFVSDSCRNVTHFNFTSLDCLEPKRISIIAYEALTASLRFNGSDSDAAASAASATGTATQSDRNGAYPVIASNSSTVFTVYNSTLVTSPFVVPQNETLALPSAKANSSLSDNAGVSTSSSSASPSVPFASSSGLKSPVGIASQSKFIVIAHNVTNIGYFKWHPVREFKQKEWVIQVRSIDSEFKSAIGNSGVLTFINQPQGPSINSSVIPGAAGGIYTPPPTTFVISSPNSTTPVYISKVTQIRWTFLDLSCGVHVSTCSKPVNVTIQAFPLSLSASTSNLGAPLSAKVHSYTIVNNTLNTGFYEWTPPSIFYNTTLVIQILATFSNQVTIGTSRPFIPQTSLVKRSSRFDPEEMSNLGSMNGVGFQSFGNGSNMTQVNIFGQGFNLTDVLSSVLNGTNVTIPGWS